MHAGLTHGSDGVNGFSQFDGPLPHSLRWEHTARMVVSQWGEPSSKCGGDAAPVCLEYEHNGCELTFVNRSWDDADNQLAFVCLF